MEAIHSMKHYMRKKMLLFDNGAGWILFIFAFVMWAGQFDVESQESCLNYLFGVMIRVKVVFRKTVVGDWRFDYLSSSHLQSQVKSRRQMMVELELSKLVIGNG